MSAEWKRLVEESDVATWWQTEEAYRFFAGTQDFHADVLGVMTDERLMGLAVILRPQVKSGVLQWFSRRALIMGGLLLSNSISDEALTALLHAIHENTTDCIYTEIRDLHDFSRWRQVMETSGWEYQPHLNIRMDTTNAVQAAERIGRHKRRRIDTTLRAGAQVVNHPTEEQLQDYYRLLRQLYKRRVRKPLPSWEFFRTLFHHPACRMVLAENEGRIIGGSVCIVWQGKALYEWYACGRDDDKRIVSPASLTKYAEIQIAGEEGIPMIDLMGAGRPDKPYGVRDFKAEFGGETVEHGRYIYVQKPILYTLGKAGMRICNL